MKVVVTGGAGFIGSHLVDAYLERGDHVYVIDNLSSGKTENLDERAELIQLDINSEELVSVLEKIQPDLINHHAAQINVRVSIERPKFDAKVNILGILNVIEGARKSSQLKKFVFASTGGAIYGETDNRPTSEDFPAWPISPYGIAKLTGEHYLHFYNQVHGLPYLSLRYANVYGPRQNPHGEAGVVAIYYQRVSDGMEFVVNGNGKQTRDFVFVKDVVKANMAASESDYEGQINIGTGKETDINTLVEKMQKTLGRSGDIPHGPGVEGEQKSSCLDNTKAQEILSWKPGVNLDDGLKDTAKFFQER